MPKLSIKNLALLTAAVLVVGYALVFYWTPHDADQGFRFQIFYLHVPMAITALGGFVVGGIFALLHLRSGERKWDVRSYVAIHQSLTLAVGVLITGAIWAKSAWGHWWLWDEPVLVSFLIVFLLYACYQPLRFSIEDPDRQSRAAAVFAITAGAFVPLNFTAVRMAEQDTHPRTLSSADGLPWEVQVTFVICLIGMALLFATLMRYELLAKSTSAKIKALRRRRGEADAAPRRTGAPELLETGA